MSLSSDAGGSPAISPIESRWCARILLHSPLSLSQSASAIFMQTGSIIYKSLHTEVGTRHCRVPTALEANLLAWGLCWCWAFGDACGTPYSRYLRFVLNAMIGRSPAQSNIRTHIQTFANCCRQLRPQSPQNHALPIPAAPSKTRDSEKN
ncbi:MULTISPECIES: hypothetical protein [unclassified Microcoleus]|uniref:hypothetical protein n=1 Tax=unclassified Microcoleus TaxID=2642155 RepID=UPI002FD2312C